MSATICIPGPLRAYAAGARELAVDAATVGEAFARLAARYPQLGCHLYADDGTLRTFVNVYVNDEEIRFLGGLAAAVGPGDEIVIVPSVAGGSASTRGGSAPRGIERDRATVEKRRGPGCTAWHDTPARCPELPSVRTRRERRTP